MRRGGFRAAVREKVAADKLQLAIELDAALKERAIALEERNKHIMRSMKVREAAAAIILEMEAEAAARAKAA